VATPAARREGVYRVYRAAGLAVRRRKKRLRSTAGPPQPACTPMQCNHWWSTDFLKDECARRKLQRQSEGRIPERALVRVDSRSAILGEALRIDFNTVRPHSRLKTPEEFVEALAGSRAARAHPHRSQADVRGIFRKNEGGS
jgi:hypothetical protein